MSENENWYIVVSKALKQEVPQVSVGQVRGVSLLKDRPDGVTPWGLSERFKTVLLTLHSESVSGSFEFRVWQAGDKARWLQFSAEDGWLNREGKALVGEKTGAVRTLLARRTLSPDDARALVTALLGKAPSGSIELWPPRVATPSVYVKPRPSVADQLLAAVRARKWPQVKRLGRDRSARRALEDEFTSAFCLDRDAATFLAGIDALGSRPRKVQAHLDELFQEALREDDLKLVRSRLVCRPDVSAGLHVARSAGAIKALVKAGAVVNARNRDGLTPLMTQLSRPWPSTTEVVRALLAHRAKPGLKAKGRDALRVLEEAVASGGKPFAEWTRDVPRLLARGK